MSKYLAPKYSLSEIETISYRLGKNICKGPVWLSAVQHIQGAWKSQPKKLNNMIKRGGKKPGMCLVVEYSPLQMCKAACVTCVCDPDNIWFHPSFPPSFSPYLDTVASFLFLKFVKLSSMSTLNSLLKSS